MRVMITGASRGIGARLAADYRARGDEVLATARTAPDGSGLCPLDVTDPAAQQALGGPDAAALDLLICNAGVFLDRGQPLETGYAPELWADSFATNVTGVFLTVQAQLPALLQASSPRIAIISSQMGSSARAGGSSYIYRASKAAALNLGRNLAVDLRPRGVALGIYHPGWVRTDMGGSGAAISVEESAAGLIRRFDALDLDRTGIFEMWNGEAMPF